MSKLWDQNKKKVNQEIEKYTVGNDYLLDKNLVYYDCLASIAHVKMLGKIKILKQSEVVKLQQALNQIIKLDKQGKFKIKMKDEDCHTAIENFLVKKLGQVGKKVHTGRSRNDQVLVALRLYTLDKIDIIERMVLILIASLSKQAKKYQSTRMPGYTHTQKAMPTTVGVWLNSFVDSLKDDLNLLLAVKKIVNQNPLGSVAGFGEDVFKLDRGFTTKQLGFSKTQKNPIYCAYSRGKFENLVLQALSQVMLDLGKLANDLILFTTKEFDFFDLPNEFKTGSSVMPQKNNFDVLELIRGNNSIFLGYQFQIQDIIKNLISGYNRDFQLTKEPYLKAIDLLLDTVNVFDLVTKNLIVKKENLETACSSELYATKEAYELVKKGVPFRDSYNQISKKFNNK